MGGRLRTRATDTGDGTYILEGTLDVHRHTARDYLAALGGSVHRSASTEHGCRFLVSASEDDELLGSADSSRRGLLFVPDGRGAWSHPETGVAVRRVAVDARFGVATVLVRMAAGSQCAVRGQQIYVLDGEAAQRWALRGETSGMWRAAKSGLPRGSVSCWPRVAPSPGLLVARVVILTMWRPSSPGRGGEIRPLKAAAGIALGQSSWSQHDALYLVSDKRRQTSASIVRVAPFCERTARPRLR
jgi:hypothetical protein